MTNARRARRFRALQGGVPAEVTPVATGGIRLAIVVGREGERFRVRAGRWERLAACDPSVDPALVEAARASGARVVLEEGPAPVIVGALATRRAVEVGPDDEVRLSVKRFAVEAAEEVVLRTRSAFLRAKGDEVELFGGRILSRARELARVLARAIQLN
ncbi:MAG TPA: hypothetical protein VGG91_18660 [Myxococcaceae bacterium]|jgi:hypothetical protein